MDACIIDWKAIATFTSAGATLIGARVAWCISQNWRYQKASEEISKESKDLWNKLDELQTFYNRLDELKGIPLGLGNKPNIDFKKELREKFFLEVKEWKYLNISKMEFVKILTNDLEVEKSIDELIEKLDSFYTHNLIQRFIHNDDITDLVKRNEVIENIENIKKSLIPFIKHSKRA